MGAGSSFALAMSGVVDDAAAIAMIEVGTNGSCSIKFRRDIALSDIVVLVDDVGVGTLMLQHIEEEETNAVVVMKPLDS